MAGLASNGTLATLVLNGCTSVGPATMSALASACKDSLELLDVSFCRCVHAHARVPCIRQRAQRMSVCIGVHGVRKLQKRWRARAQAHVPVTS